MSTPSDPDYPPLLHEQRIVLRAYAAEHGRRWKECLLAEWIKATADPLLHRLRNTHGPSWLLAYRLDTASGAGHGPGDAVARSLRRAPRRHRRAPAQH
ncbi:hypothetical protein WDZ11_24085 (plasmid) [Roseomonas mucosa]|uniref:hypothetical protein n=1 Tax=Roseomonas mucosa TaxID=207340 RepID=UPI0030D14345